MMPCILIIQLQLVLKIGTFKSDRMHPCSSRGCQSARYYILEKNMIFWVRGSILPSEFYPAHARRGFFLISNFDTWQIGSLLSCKDALYLIWKSQLKTNCSCVSKERGSTFKMIDMDSKYPYFASRNSFSGVLFPPTVHILNFPS